MYSGEYQRPRKNQGSPEKVAFACCWATNGAGHKLLLSSQSAGHGRDHGHRQAAARQPKLPQPWPGPHESMPGQGRLGRTDDARRGGGEVQDMHRRPPSSSDQLLGGSAPPPGNCHERPGGADPPPAPSPKQLGGWRAAHPPSPPWPQRQCCRASRRRAPSPARPPWSRPSRLG